MNGRKTKMNIGGTIKSYKETYGEDICPKIVEEKFCALMVLIHTKDVQEFSKCYHILTDTNSKKILKGFYRIVNQPLKCERRF
jgi:hypothetical protein